MNDLTSTTTSFTTELCNEITQTNKYHMTKWQLPHATYPYKSSVGAPTVDQQEGGH